MRMYDYTGKFAMLEDMMLEGSLDEETYKDTLESLEGSAVEKAENLGRMIDNFKADEKKLKEEVDALNKKRKTLKNSVDFLMNELENFHKVSGIERAGMYKLTYRKLPPSVDIIDLESVPEVYVKVKREASKSDIKKAIQDGLEVPGASLNTNKTKFGVSK